MQKEYKSQHDWVRKGIYWELLKRLKLDHTDEWEMYKPESAIENEMRKFLLDFAIQMNRLIEVRKPALMLIDKIKRTCHFVLHPESK